MPAHTLDGVHALLFDVFGTVVNWHDSIVRELEHKAPFSEDWSAFAREWRAGYIRITLHVARGGKCPTNVDEIHRQILEEMLASPRWSKLTSKWDDAIRADLVQAWHCLDGWPDVVPGLNALKQKRIIGTLSNGNVKLLIDMAKHAHLPWDVIFSSALFGSYKPNPAIYNGAVRNLSLAPHEVAFVAAHIDDCAAARRCGLRTVYVRRPTEDIGRNPDSSQIDLVVDSFEELARLLPDPSQRAKL